MTDGNVISGAPVLNEDGSADKSSNIQMMQKVLVLVVMVVVSYVDGDGELQTAGQISIAKFSNNGGLEKIGSNKYPRNN